MNNIITIAYFNIRGQTKMNEAKQSQLEDMIRKYKIDILHLQEADIEENTFDTCPLICSSYDIIPNNSQNGYGTASIYKSDLTVTNIRLDTLSKCIVFDVGDLTLANVYLQSGTDARSRAAREDYCAATLPQLLLNHQRNCIVGGTGMPSSTRVTPPTIQRPRCLPVCPD